MNAPTPALVAPRPERLRLVGQRRQILTMMHQRLMFGLLVYAGVVALIVVRILYLAAFGDHAGAKRGLTALAVSRACPDSEDLCAGEERKIAENPPSAVPPPCPASHSAVMFRSLMTCASTSGVTACLGSGIAGDAVITASRKPEVAPAAAARTAAFTSSMPAPQVWFVQ